MEERIDKYVLGKMSDNECRIFEEEMANDITLQERVDLRRDIVRAISRKAAKIHLQQVERNIQQSKRRHRVFAIYASCVAVAACLIIGVFVHFDTASDYRQYGLNNIELKSSALRGGKSCADRAIDAINNGSYELALTIIQEGQDTPFVCNDTNIELVEQARIEYEIEQDDLQWFKAVTYMRMGKWIKARKLLKQIALSDSYYKTDAQKALNAL